MNTKPSILAYLLPPCEGIAAFVTCLEPDVFMGWAAPAGPLLVIVLLLCSPVAALRYADVENKTASLALALVLYAAYGIVGALFAGIMKPGIPGVGGTVLCVGLLLGTGAWDYAMHTSQTKPEENP